MEFSLNVSNVFLNCDSSVLMCKDKETRKSTSTFKNLSICRRLIIGLDVCQFPNWGILKSLLENETIYLAPRELLE